MGFALLCLCVAGLVAACQPLPRPFAPKDKGGNALLRPGFSTGIVVNEVEGAPAPAAKALAAAMAAALRASDLPASTYADNRRSLSLHGRAAAEPLDSVRDEIRISWELSDSRGRVFGRHVQRAQALNAAWERGAPALLQALAAQAAPEIARLGDDDAAPAAPPAAGPKLVLLPVDGAPGDGRTSLTRAMAYHLRKGGLEPSEEITDDSLVLLGSVRVSDGVSGMQRVDITWTAIRADGTEVGTITQANRVAPGALDGPWGDIAFAVAEDGAAGVAELLERMADRNLRKPY